MPNRLAAESSPYLLQHAENPVEWYPWGDEAFARARAEERPILLSVGYSSCHWCHVMAHESFEDPSIAALMNEGFVNIKVDREERPDVDAVYMAATQAMSGQGGWPMTVFLTPSGEPFFAGTYFPPDDRYGRPGFPSVLEAVRKAWEGDRARVVESAQTITERLREATARAGEARGTSVDAGALEATVESLCRVYDAFWGGFGRAPKFPNPSVIEFLLGRHALGGGRNEDGAAALEMATHTLRRMAQGGMYDHLGGGFARYSTDERWLVPHFEKMLYDNAQLARVYLHASLVAEAPEDRAHYERVARETLDYLVREMRDSGGGFHSAQDADSEGIEGKFFVWTPEEIEATLAPEDAALVRAYYGVTPHGNFEDPHHPEFGRRTVLHTPRAAAEVADELGIEEGALLERLPALRARLLEVREQRVRPGLDDKVLTSWNGLALSAFAEAGRVLGDTRYLDVAREVATFLERDVWREGRLLHSYRAGVAKIDGMLEDYAYVGLGLVDLYRATGDLDRLRWAGALLEVMLARFRDDASGGFFDTPDDGETLLVRQRSTYDGPTPSGNAAAAHLAAWLGRYFDRHEWDDVARAVVAASGDAPAQYPSAFGALLQVLELLTAERRELAIVGAPAARAPLEREAAARFSPTLVLASSDAGGGLPLLDGRESMGGAAAYVCRDMVCDLPVTTIEGLRAQLAALESE